jgi:hypothetical protein
MVSWLFAGQNPCGRPWNIIGGGNGFGFNLIMAGRGGADCLVSFSHEIKASFQARIQVLYLEKVFLRTPWVADHVNNRP